MVPPSGKGIIVIRFRFGIPRHGSIVSLIPLVLVQERRRDVPTDLSFEGNAAVARLVKPRLDLFEEEVQPRLILDAIEPIASKLFA